MRHIDLRIVLLLACSVLALVVFWPASPVKLPPGAVAPPEPLQEPLEEPPTWVHDDFMFTALARYEITARILARERYYLDDGAALSPIDFALGWGDVSDQTVIDALDIWQGGRRYQWQTTEGVLSVAEISRQSANVHMIPANDDVEDELLDAPLGGLVTFKGYLVQIEGENGWRWRSSLSRDDVGDGACEVFWVEEVQNAPD